MDKNTERSKQFDTPYRTGAAPGRAVVPALVAMVAVLMVAITGCSDDPGVDQSGDAGVHSNDNDGNAGDDSADAGDSNGDDSDAGGDDTDTNGGDDPGDDEVYASDGSPYEPGELAVDTLEVSEQEAGVPVWIATPQQPGTYPLVVFQHGFLMANTYYSEMLEQVASHGFVVAAPQMYEPGGLFDAPSVQEEAALANEVYDWLDDHIDEVVDVTVATDRFGLAGHSRGAQAIWWALDAQPRSVDGVVGVDPVDGSGGPLDDGPRVLDDPPEITAAKLLVGTGLGGESRGGLEPACAPEDDNYEAFFAAADAPVYQTVAVDYGHLDMLNDDPQGCGFECDACVEGDSREPMRQFTAGQLVGLFRATLQGQDDAYGVITDQAQAPISIETDSRL